MKKIKLQSSLIAAVTYHAQEQILRVEFVSGKVYSYFGVDEKTYRDLLKAESKGRYFNYRIRNEFPYEEGIRPKVRRHSAG